MRRRILPTTSGAAVCIRITPSTSIHLFGMNDSVRVLPHGDIVERGASLETEASIPDSTVPNKCASRFLRPRHPFRIISIAASGDGEIDSVLARQSSCTKTIPPGQIDPVNNPSGCPTSRPRCDCGRTPRRAGRRATTKPRRESTRATIRQAMPIPNDRASKEDVVDRN